MQHNHNLDLENWRGKEPKTGIQDDSTIKMLSLFFVFHMQVFNSNKFLDYLKGIYPSQMTVEKAKKLHHLANYVDLTFMADSGGKPFNQA